MKKYFPLLFILLMFQSCLKDKHSEKRTYTANAPIYMTYENLARTINTEEPLELCVPRKIYASGKYLFINELGKGIHIVDNSNPSNPQNISFINIPGNVDLTIKGNYLYVDSYSDLVTLDISDVNKVKEVCRKTKIFEYVLPKHNPKYPISLVDPSKGVVIGWEIKEVTEVCENGICGAFYDVPQNERLVLNNTVSGESGGGLQAGKMEGVSVAGSMSRFMLRANNLYTISSISKISIFDVTNESCPSFTNEVELQTGIETLFSYKEHLFVGAETGMYIYSLLNPEKPTYISVFDHVRSCDPVVVYNDRAYVTTRGSGNCGGWVNQLDVVDISNIKSPRSIVQYNMSEPFGLGIDGQNDVLFVCDGNSGVRIFDNISQQVDNGYLTPNGYTINNNGYDVIPLGGQLMVIGNDGLYQYDYSIMTNIKQTSVIATSQCK